MVSKELLAYPEIKEHQVSQDRLGNQVCQDLLVSLVPQEHLEKEEMMVNRVEMVPQDNLELQDKMVFQEPREHLVRMASMELLEIGDQTVHRVFQAKMEIQEEMETQEQLDSQDKLDSQVSFA